jgi:hypothetical protein
MKRAATDRLAARLMLKRITRRNIKKKRRNEDPPDHSKSGSSDDTRDDVTESEDEEIEKRVLENYANLVWKMYPPIQKITRLHRKNLVDRLVFEEDLRYGIARLFRQILVFIFLMETVNLSKNVKAMRGIYVELDNSFDFYNLRKVTSRDDFISHWIPALSAHSKKYFIRGSQYFDTGGAGAVQLHGGTEVFTQPKSLGGLSISIYLQSYSFTAWVQVAPEFVGGYIFRKRLLPTSPMICWGELSF